MKVEEKRGEGSNQWVEKKGWRGWRRHPLRPKTMPKPDLIRFSFFGPSRKEAKERREEKSRNLTHVCSCFDFFRPKTEFIDPLFLPRLFCTA